MRLERIKHIVAASYIVSIVTVGLAAGITAPAGWVALTAIALLPAGALLTLWTHPAPTTSQAIQEARR